MRLTELHGYHKYEKQDLGEILTALRDDFTANYQGSYSVVVISKQHDYVYKLWTADPAYEAYYKLALTMQGNRYIPKFGKLHKLPIFFKRQGHIDGYINAVKLEKLQPIPGTLRIAADLAAFIQNLAKVKVGLTGYTREHGQREVKRVVDQAKRFTGDLVGTGAQHVREAIPTFHELLDKLHDTSDDLYELAIALNKLFHEQDGKVFFDLHESNLMLRGSQLVVIDPFAMSHDAEARQRDNGVIFIDDVISTKFDNEPAVVKSGSRPRLKS